MSFISGLNLETLFSVKDKNIIVTGAGSGIGQIIAVSLAQLGAAVCCFDLGSSTGLLSTKATIEKNSGRCHVFHGDVTKEADMLEAIIKFEKDFGPVSGAVNAAGIADAAATEDMQLQQWDRVINVNLTGIFLSCKAQGKAMLAQGGGSIVNIASMSGIIANRGLKQVHYNASKAGVIHLTKSLAVEWATRGVRVNSISPGYTLTPMNKRPEVAEHLVKFAEETPMARIAEMAEMVGPAIFLLSHASSFCTGTDIVVDGGFTCW